MVNHQAKHAKGLEDIIRNLLTDLQGVSKRAKLMDSRTSALEARSSDTYEAPGQVLPGLCCCSPDPVPDSRRDDLLASRSVHNLTQRHIRVPPQHRKSLILLIDLL